MLRNIEQKTIFNSSLMDPRISFSNDFADAPKFESSLLYREAPVSTDNFEFSVRNNYNIMSSTTTPADEIFCKGKILPLKDESSNQLRRMTQRDELKAEDEDEGEEFDPFSRVVLQQQKSSGWWKDRLGLRRGTTHNMVSKKGEIRNNGGLERIVEEKRNVFLQQHDGFGGKNIGIVD